MEVENTEPPDGGGFSKGECGGPGLPSSQAAAVKASLHGGREAKTAGGYVPGEGVMRMETAAAAVVSSPAEGARGAQGGLQGGIGPGPPTSLTAAVMASPTESRETFSQEGHLPGDSNGSKEATAAASVLIQAGKGPEGIADMKTPEAGAGGNTPLEERRPPGDDWSTVVRGKTKRPNSCDKAENINNDKDDGRGIGRLARKLREGEPRDTEPRRNNEIREGDCECKDQHCGETSAGESIA